MRQKWFELLARLEESDSLSRQEVWTQEELLTFQLETGIILPADYQEFCQIFGTVMLGNYMRIFCPDISFSNWIKEVIKDEMNEFPINNRGEAINTESIKKLLDSAFFFGDNADAEVVLWDLSTYDESDKSCDIYLARTKDFQGDIYQIGRDFFEFICEFCLGSKAYETLPEWMQPRAENISYTLTRFKPN